MKFQLLFALIFAATTIMGGPVDKPGKGKGRGKPKVIKCKPGKGPKKLTQQQSIALQSNIATATNLPCIPQPPYTVNETQIIDVNGISLYDPCNPQNVLVTLTSGTYNISVIQSDSQTDQCRVVMQSSIGVQGKDAAGATYKIDDKSLFVSSYNLTSPILDQDYNFAQTSIFRSIKNGQNPRPPGKKGAVKGALDKKTYSSEVKCVNCPFCTCTVTLLINNEDYCPALLG